MASPQKENGHVDIANEVIEALARLLLSPDEWRCLLFIIRKTWGWHKKEDWISLSQFYQGTSIRKPHVCRAISKLVLRNVVTRSGNGITRIGNDYGITYGFQKDYEKWKALPKRATLPKQVMSVTQTGNEPLPKQVPTKETSKNTITKEKDLWSIFMMFWEVYPKKVGRKAAYKAWLKAKDKPSIEKILSSLEAQKKSDQWKKESGKYIPNPATWINDGRWDDEVKEETWVQKVESLL